MYTIADSDLQIRGGGGGGEQSQKNNFSRKIGGAHQPQPPPPRPSPLDPPLARSKGVRFDRRVRMTW